MAAEEILEHPHEGFSFFYMVGNFSIFIKFRGDERAQVFKLPGEVVVFSIGEVYVVSFFLFSFLSSLVSLREGGSALPQFWICFHCHLRALSVQIF